MRKYRAIDLFAGIGGIRLGFEQAFKDHIQFVFSCESDKYCRKTYLVNFKEIPKGDIRKFPIKMINDFDILLAGFPCQSFSRAGKKEGFKSEYGNLFYYIRDILIEKEPSAFLLENVDNLVIHDKGHSFLKIKYILESELKYYIHYKLLNAFDFGLPQKRNRIYIVGFRKNLKFNFPDKIFPKVTIESIVDEKVSEKYYLSQKYLKTLEKHKNRHKLKGHGFGYEILQKKDIANTLVTGGMGRERNLIIGEENFNNSLRKGHDNKERNQKKVRMLSERECARLQGFPEHFKLHSSTTHAYKQIANSVPIPVIREIALEMKNALDNKIVLKTKRSIQKNLIHFIIKN